MLGNERLSKGKFYGKYVMFGKVKIAYRELLSAVLALILFAPKFPSSFVRINCDNTNVVSWLNKGRCAKRLGYRLLSVIELIKLRFSLKVSVFYIKSSSNTSADLLSRGEIPLWLKTRGSRLSINMRKIDRILSNPVLFWKKALLV